ncbi:uncharacterized protein LOC127948529 [Carassius gibelio]|uniref:uncharacterized protein LOC127948529 n=1 Tax=Carassius gibelio TaxID=101364 RepID=UPI002277B764|nr:uncharacterized protein LOC127948529 [Carassius gibelio]
MEWRIIVPVLCLIGFLSVPGYVAGNNSTDTTNNSTNITNTIATTPSTNNNTNITNTIATTLSTNNNTNITNTIATTLSTNNNTNITNTITTTPSTNSTTNSTTTSPTNNSPTTFDFNITFHIDETFNANFTDMTNSATIALKNRIVSQITPAYTQIKNFQRFDILQFRNGSIVVDGKLIFNNSDSKPSVANLTQILNNGNFSFKVLSNLTSVAEVTTTAGTTTTTASATTQAVTTSAGTKLYIVVFKIMQNFTDDLSNLTSPAAINLTNTVIFQFEKVFKTLKSYRRMTIRQFRKGSIEVDSSVEFDKASPPTLQEVAKAFTDAVNNGNFTLQINATSILVTDPSAPANKSPVLASILTAFWMTLASLLFSAVMH